MIGCRTSQDRYSRLSPIDYEKPINSNDNVRYSTDEYAALRRRILSQDELSSLNTDINKLPPLIEMAEGKGLSDMVDGLRRRYQMAKDKIDAHYWAGYHLARESHLIARRVIASGGDKSLMDKMLHDDESAILAGCEV